MYKEIENEEELRITEEHFNEFKNAKSFQEKISILNAHSKQNQKRIIIRRKRKMEENKNGQQNNDTSVNSSQGTEPELEIVVTIVSTFINSLM